MGQRLGHAHQKRKPNPTVRIPSIQKPAPSFLCGSRKRSHSVQYRGILCLLYQIWSAQPFSGLLVDQNDSWNPNIDQSAKRTGSSRQVPFDLHSCERRTVVNTIPNHDRPVLTGRVGDTEGLAFPIGNRQTQCSAVADGCHEKTNFPNAVDSGHTRECLTCISLRVSDYLAYIGVAKGNPYATWQVKHPSSNTTCRHDTDRYE